MDKPVLWNLNWKFYDYFVENLTSSRPITSAVLII